MASLLGGFTHGGGMIGSDADWQARAFLHGRCRRALPSPHSLDTAPTRLRAKYPTTAGRILPRRMVRRFLRQREVR